MSAQLVDEHDNRHAAQHDDHLVKFTVTLPAAEKDKFIQCWAEWKAGDRYEKRLQARNADREQGIKSLLHLIDLVMRKHYTCGSSYTIAGVLGSLYNGERVKANLFPLSNLDGDILEHVLNVIRLHHDASLEIHNYVDDGSRIFEKMITAYRLEKRRRKS